MEIALTFLFIILLITSILFIIEIASITLTAIAMLITRAQDSAVDSTRDYFYNLICLCIVLALAVSPTATLVDALLCFVICYFMLTAVVSNIEKIYKELRP